MFAKDFKEDGLCNAMELDINAIVSSISIVLHNRFDANALQLDKASTNMVIVAIAKAVGMNSSPITNRSSLSNPFLLSPIIKTKSKVIMSLLTNQNAIVASTSDYYTL